jgi:hypothetical protein
MSHKRPTIDERPGSLPDIQAADNSVIYAMVIDMVPRVRLVIRCDAHGDVWASVA